MRTHRNDIYGVTRSDMSEVASRLSAALGVPFSPYQDFYLGGEFYKGGVPGEVPEEVPEFWLWRNRNPLYRQGIDLPSEQYAEPDYPEMALLLEVDAEEADADALRVTLPEQFSDVQFLKADDRQQRLLQHIEQAFRGITLGEGVSLHETIAVDDYGNARQREEARAPDEKHDWHKLVDDPELWQICGVGGLSFYDGAGLRFHLPAYLSLAVQDHERDEVGEILASLLFCLSHLSEYNRERFSHLDKAQRRCVQYVLAYLGEMCQDSPELERAIQEYWSE